MKYKDFDYDVNEQGVITNLKTNKVLKQYDAHGYLFVALYKDNKKYQLKVHRLVAELFIPNPNNLPYVNHKNENKKDNSVSNLEWCDAQYNTNYGTRNEKVSAKLINRKDTSKPIAKLDLNGEIIETYLSVKDVNREMGKKVDANIIKCCKGKHKTAYGYKWKYLE